MRKLQTEHEQGVQPGQIQNLRRGEKELEGRVSLEEVSLLSVQLPADMQHNEKYSVEK